MTMVAAQRNIQITTGDDFKVIWRFDGIDLRTAFQTTLGRNL